VFWKKEGRLVQVLVKDPICGMDVDPEHAYYTEIGERKYYFCGAGCKAAFKRANNNNHAYSGPLKVRKAHRRGGGCCH